MSETRAISTKSRRELSSSSSPPPPHDKATKEIHAILTETLICFLPGRAKDLSAPLYNKALPQLLCSNSIIIRNKSYLNIFCPAVVLLLVSHTGFSEHETQRRTHSLPEICFLNASHRCLEPIRSGAMSHLITSQEN